MLISPQGIVARRIMSRSFPELDKFVAGVKRLSEAVHGRTLGALSTTSKDSTRNDLRQFGNYPPPAKAPGRWELRHERSAAGGRERETSWRLFQTSRDAQESPEPCGLQGSNAGCRKELCWG